MKIPNRYPLISLSEKPYNLASLAMVWGWLQAALKGKARYEDPEFRKFLQRYQRRSLLVGKMKATEELHRESKLDR